MPGTLVRATASHLDHRPAQVLVVAERAAGQPQQLVGRHEAIAEAERVDGEPLLRAGYHPPVRVDGRVHHLLDPSVALGGDDDAPVAQRHAAAGRAAAGSRPVAQQLRLPGGRPTATRAPRRARGRAGLEGQHDVHAVVPQLGRERQRQRAAAGEGDPVSPGTTRDALTSAWAPPAVTTPGSVQPGKATGRSCAPGATRTRRARSVVVVAAPR